MTRTLLVAGAVVVGGLISIGAFELLHDPDLAGGVEPAAAEGLLVSATWSVLLYAVMILGVLASHVYAVASDRYSAGQPVNGPGDLLETLRGAPRIWMALAVSPLLFHAVHAAAATAPDDGAALFFAFQNGFFWQAVFAGFKERVPVGKAAAAPAA